MSSSWYYARQGQTFGPYTSPQLRDLARQGKLVPDDLVSREGATKWVPAGTIPNLFAGVPAAPPAAPPPVPARVPVSPPALDPPRPGPTPPPLAAGKKPPPWARTLLALPKPVLFGLFGGTGGLLGALILGELLWLILSPRGLAAEPPLQVAVPASVQVYPGSKNRFLVKVARHGISSPVTVEALSPPAGVSVPAVTVPADKDEVEVEVAVTDTVAPAKHSITIQARAPDAPSLSPVSAKLELAVEPVPPGLAVAVSPRVAVKQGDKARFTVRVARAHFDGDVFVSFKGAPEGLSLLDAIVPAGATEATAEVSPPAAAPVGEFPITVVATSLAGGESVTDRAVFPLIIEERPVPTVDVVFVLDLTGSMGFAINGIKKGIQSFVEGLERDRLDARIALVGFRDIQADRERPFVLKFNGETFTKDYSAVRAAVGKLRASGGGDTPESSLQGLALAAQQTFRPSASRVLVFITDAPPKIHPGETPSTVAQTVDELTRHEITQLHMVVGMSDLNRSYKPLRTKFPGSDFDIQKATSGDAFKDLLPSLSKAISSITVAAGPKDVSQPAPPPLSSDRAVKFPTPPKVPTLQAVQSTEAFAAKDRFRLLLAIVVWTMVIAATISLFIVAGQQFHARQSWIDLPQGLRAFGGGLPAGIAGGFIGQMIFQSAAVGSTAWDTVSRVLGWSFLGAMSGMILAFFVPNLKWSRGMVGGFVGGILGALGFILVGLLVGSLLGRWLGAAILGFCIGLMVALAELVFRRWWLEIAVSPREVRTVTLGEAAVSLGGDEKRSSFYVAGAAPVALRYRIAGESVLCEDVTTGETSEVEPGDRRTLGRVTITVCSPASTQKTGFTLNLSGGRALRLQEGMPLTTDDLPGLEPQGQDGMVALVARPPSQAKGVILLRNRSQQSWKARKRDGTMQVVEPGRGIELTVGLQFDFGHVQGVIRPEEDER